MMRAASQDQSLSLRYLNTFSFHFEEKDWQVVWQPVIAIQDA